VRSHLRLASVVGAFALSTVAITPAMAAAPVSQSGANAVTVSIAGNAQGTGDVTATNDGSSEKKTGDATPPLSVLGGQSLLNAGVLAQEATARKDSTSAACAGLAGNGGSVVAIGSSRCLNPGTPVNATLGSLDLSKLVVADPASALAPLNQVTDAVLAQRPDSQLPLTRQGQREAEEVAVCRVRSLDQRLLRPRSVGAL
jgi:hypothetical protein